MQEPGYPEVYEDDNGLVRVRCDTSGKEAVSQQVGDGGPEGALEFIRQIADVADLEYDEDAVPGKVVISVPPGA
jgi:hypothetical protein